MTDEPAYHCENCNEPVTLRRREWDNHLLVGCDCEERTIRISRKSPEGWNADG